MENIFNNFVTFTIIFRGASIIFFFKFMFLFVYEHVQHNTAIAVLHSSFVLGTYASDYDLL